MRSCRTVDGYRDIVSAIILLSDGCKSRSNVMNLTSRLSCLSCLSHPSRLSCIHLDYLIQAYSLLPATVQGVPDAVTILPEALLAVVAPSTPYLHTPVCQTGSSCPDYPHIPLPHRNDPPSPCLLRSYVLDDWRYLSDRRACLRRLTALTAVMGQRLASTALFLALSEFLEASTKP